MICRLVMGFQVIFVLLFFTGIDAEINSTTRCLETMKFQEDIDPFIKLGDTNQLELFCTDMTHFFSCINHLMRYFTFRELAKHWFMNETKPYRFLSTLDDLEYSVVGKCRSGVQLNMDFLMDIHCLKGDYLEVIPVKHCVNQSAFAYFTFSNSLPERQFSEKDSVCTITAYQLGCIATTVRAECGVEAFNKYISLVRTSRFFRDPTCSLDFMQILKTTFLESLNLSESQKNIYRTIFDLKKVRRKGSPRYTGHPIR